MRINESTRLINTRISFGIGIHVPETSPIELDLNSRNHLLKKMNDQKGSSYRLYIDCASFIELFECAKNMCVYTYPLHNIKGCIDSKVGNHK